jgi:deoxyribodipyrimidine photolyase-related protein
MEFFYRDMRRRHGYLMDGGQPAGGKWNYDAENRKALPKSVRAPALPVFEPDAVTRDVMVLVSSHFASHLGSAEDFGFPVTAADARVALRDFIAHRLPGFGDWQDAMKTGEPFLFHAVISPALNLGLLGPREICAAAEAAWRGGHAELNAVEGFIRQILGWREFIRGIYWLHMPGYASKNFFSATRKLPWFYWTGETRMNCLRQAITSTIAHAYAHHIQRLMITGNFALLAGLHPDAVDEWYLAVYADAYEWVEMPNTRGMALHADGGAVGSKPYAASGAYINRMSDYCGGCYYEVKDGTGERGCPFNALYWDFIARHAERFENNPRMAMPVRSVRKMAPAKLAALRQRAAWLLKQMEMGAQI